jgi:hypothetical protein
MEEATSDVLLHLRILKRRIRKKTEDAIYESEKSIKPYGSISCRDI